MSKIKFPKKLKTIGDNAFFQCTQLASIYIPENVDKIGDGAFGGTKSLGEIIVDSNNKYYDSRGNCNAIIDSYNNVVIAACKNTNIPNSVEKICKSCFTYEDLSNFNFPQNLIDDLIYNSENNTSVCSLDFSLGIEDDFNGIYSKNGKRFIGLDNYEIGAYKIKKGVEYICIGAFSQCSLKSVYILKSVLEIGDMAFCMCDKLENIELPNNLTRISDKMFYGCKSLKSISIPEGVNVIGNEAFGDCKRLKSIYLPSSVDLIKNDVFENCYDLNAIIVPNRCKKLYDCLLPQFRSIIIEEPSSNVSARETKFGFFDIRLSGGYRVRREYKNILEHQEYNANDIKDIKYDKSNEIIYLTFKSVLKDGYNTICFLIRFEKIIIKFYNNGSYVMGYDSVYDRTTTLKDLYNAMSILKQTKENNVIITLNGEAYASEYIGNFYTESMMSDLERLYLWKC